MREIKFRGKRTDNGKWVYGDLIKWETGSKDIAPTESDNIQYSVILDTIGQFTGLKDKNGREIFEGDILECELFPLYRFEVRWRENYACFALYLALNDDNPYELDYIKLITKKITKVGNIYDNPELLENNRK